MRLLTREIQGQKMKSLPGIPTRENIYKCEPHLLFGEGSVSVSVCFLITVLSPMNTLSIRELHSFHVALLSRH